MSSSSPSEIASRIENSTLESARTKDGLINLLYHARETWKVTIRRMVLERRRLDVLSQIVLGYEVHPRIHLPIIRHQFTNTQSLTLAARGFGKTTIGSIAKILHIILIAPNIQILLGSKVAGNAEDILSEIKGHFENNEELIDIFGDHVGLNNWEQTSITVKTRRTWKKEPSVMTVGVGSAIASKHFDVLIGDDLVDEENSRTEHQRQNLRVWFYKTYLPTLHPPDPLVPFRGESHLLGTRYHYGDLYGHLLRNEMKKRTLILPSLDENDESIYPERFSTEYLHSLRERAGPIIFGSQFMCNTDAMKGDIFDYDNCMIETQFPPLDSLSCAMGVDLAISRKSTSDFFAIVVVGKDERDHFWVLDYYRGKLSFSEQLKMAESYYKRFEQSLRGAWIEAVAYQAAMPEEFKRAHKDWNIRPIKTHKDKVTRAHKLAALFEQKRIHFKPDHHAVIDELVTFPHGSHDDLFDALEMAIQGLRFREPRHIERENFGLL